jgi:hypothetical protein
MCKLSEPVEVETESAGVPAEIVIPLGLDPLAGLLSPCCSSGPRDPCRVLEVSSLFSTAFDLSAYILSIGSDSATNMQPSASQCGW